MGRKSSRRKLNGQYYTPLWLAERILDRLSWPQGGPLLDPACGDGVFLEAAVRKAARVLAPAEAARAVEHIEGWDLDPEALEVARHRLDPLLAQLGIPGARPRLVHRDGLSPDHRRYATVVGNPPYLEAKRMPDGLKARIRRDFPLAGRGAFDLYAAFVEQARALAEVELALVIPNRFLVLAANEALRRALLETHRVFVEDLSRAEVFGDAAVYPIVLSAVPREGQASWPGEVDAQVADRTGVIPVPPSIPAERRLFQRLLTEERLLPLGTLLDIRWTISFHRRGLRDWYVFPSRPSSPHARPFLGGGRFSGNREVEPCRISWDGWWIDYDRSRAREDGNPLPSSALFEPPKLAICQNARRARAAVDREGHVLKDTFLAGVPRQPDVDLEWLALVLGSDVFHHLYEHLFAGTRKRGGYLHFLARTLSPCPVPAPHPAAATCYARLAQGDGDAWKEVERLVRRAYGLTDEEEEALDALVFPKRYGRGVVRS